MDLAGVECRPHYSAATSTSTSGVGFTEEQQRKESIEYNYRREAPLQLHGAKDAVFVGDFRRAAAA